MGRYGINGITRFPAASQEMFLLARVSSLRTWRGRRFSSRFHRLFLRVSTKSSADEFGMAGSLSSASAECIFLAFSVFWNLAFTKLRVEKTRPFWGEKILSANLTKVDVTHDSTGLGPATTVQGLAWPINPQRRTFAAGKKLEGDPNQKLSEIAEISVTFTQLMLRWTQLQRHHAIPWHLCFGWNDSGNSCHSPDRVWVNSQNGIEATKISAWPCSCWNQPKNKWLNPYWLVQTPCLVRKSHLFCC